MVANGHISYIKLLPPTYSLIFMPTNEASKQDGAKNIVASKVYQVAYCLEIKYSWDEVWWQIWYLLKCPPVGFGNLAEASQMAKEWKTQRGAKFQPVIIGETDEDFEIIDFDSLFGISVIGELDDREVEFPDVLFEESGFL
jgi:hypothetical protein